MSEQKKSGSDAYEELLQRYERTGDRRPAPSREAPSPRSSAAGRSSGRPVQRSAQQRPAQQHPAASRQNVKRTSSQSSRTGAKRTASSNGKLTKKQRNFRRRMKNAASNLFIVFIVIVIVALSSLALKAPIMGCIGDVVGIDRTNNEIRISVEDGMKVDDIIDVLKDKDLIFSSAFCKLAATFFHYDKDKVYSAGTFDLSPAMGIETMLNTIIAAGEKQNTVTVTFPEGLTVDQIIQKLSDNGVASAESLYEALNTESFYETYSFLADIKDDEGRARKLEGYLTPDTYEFYIGEDPQSVINRFLTNFNNKWTELYTEKAQSLGLSTDQVLTVASILEKEGNDAEQMRMIASILYNRLNSSSFAYINCDSTQFYVASFEDKVDPATYESLLYSYDTYKCTGLPRGAICNPGIAAIEAALDPEVSDYYYFLHDGEGNMYVARTEAEHNANSKYLP